MVRTRHFHCQGPGSIPGRGTKIPKAAKHGQKIKKIKGKLEFYKRLLRNYKNIGVGKR